MIVRSRQEDSGTVVEATGELDMTAVPRLAVELDQVLERGGPPHLVIDLTQVPFCDSVGLGLLVNTLNRVREANGRLILVVAPGMITHLLTITNLDRHFETRTTVDDASTALRTAA